LADTKSLKAPPRRTVIVVVRDMAQHLSSLAYSI